MIIYTVLRHIENEHRTIPLRSFTSSKDAHDWAALQMKFLDKCYNYSVAMWSLNQAAIVPCFDRRLRLAE